MQKSCRIILLLEIKDIFSPCCIQRKYLFKEKALQMYQIDMNNIILIGVGTGSIAFATMLWIYVRKTKSKLRRFVLRHLGGKY